MFHLLIDAAPWCNHTYLRELLAQLLGEEPDAEQHQHTLSEDEADPPARSSVGKCS